MHDSKWLRIGNRWFNPAHVCYVEGTCCDPDQTCKVKLQMHGGHPPWEFEGDDAEAVMTALGCDKNTRAHEAKAAARAKADADAMAEHKAKNAEKEASHAHKRH